MSTRWQRRSDVPRGDDYDQRWQKLSAEGHNVHGEADLVAQLLAERRGTRVLDAGCGTGRVAIELARRGFAVAGVDADAQMLDSARTKAPKLIWAHADLADLGSAAEITDNAFDLVLLAGNVMIFVNPGTEQQVMGNLAAVLSPGGLVVAGFTIRSDRLSVAEYDRLAEAAGLHFVARYSTWDRAPFGGGDYAVSVHRS